MDKYVVVGGDSGVYSGYLLEGLGADGRVVLRDARHLRRYYTAGRVGDGSISDVARLGIDPTSPSITRPAPGSTTLLGVRRMVDVSDAALPSFA